MSGDVTAVYAALCGGVVVTAAEPVMIPLLRNAAVIDVPGRRSSHSVSTPRGGGAPIAAGVLAAAALVHTWAALMLGTAVAGFAVIGLADDIRGLTAGRRLALQAAVALAAAIMLIRPLAAFLAAVSIPLATPVALAMVAALAVAWLVGFVNAFNFMDGVNGIAGVHAVIAGLTYACLGNWDSDGFLLASGAAVAAGALAFLPWNAVRARVFLGDVGSYGVGGALAVLAAYAVLHGIPLEAATAPLALYLADTAWTLQRRVRAGEPWHQAHRTHIYQRWCDLGWSHQRVTVVAGAATALLVMLGSASLTPDGALRIAADLAGAAVLAVYLASPFLLGHPGLPGRAGTRDQRQPVAGPAAPDQPTRRAEAT